MRALVCVPFPIDAKASSNAAVNFASRSRTR